MDTDYYFQDLPSDNKAIKFEGYQNKEITDHPSENHVQNG